MIQQILFAIVAIAVFGFAFDRYNKIYRNIRLGKDYDTSGSEAARMKNMLLVAFGQKKMFKRLIPALLHLCVYIAFVVTQIELIEILIDGFTGNHRYFYPLLSSISIGGFDMYWFIISSIEGLSVLALVATFAFLARRNLLKIPRFRMSEMKGWPKIDGNVILMLEIILVTCIFTMNAADDALYRLGHTHTNGLHHEVGSFGFAVTAPLGDLMYQFFGQFDEMGIWMLEILERAGWWGHILVVFLFLGYLPFSKHLHIMLAFPNTYFAPLNSRGEMENMPDVMNEVKMMMGLTDMDGSMDDPGDELPEFGAKDIFGLSWKNILDSYTCTECGRCTSVCPANVTGKKLSPRKVVMAVRDRAEEVGTKIDSGDYDANNFDDGKSLFDYISREEIHACTTCNACVEACPVMINPLEPILKMRRYEILTESAGPGDWVPMFTSIENGGSPWQVADARDKWATDATKENE